MEGLVERGAELAEIGAQLARAGNGEGRLVVIEGPAGIGKSRLLAETRRRAQASGPQPLLVLSARGSELEQEFAFGVVRQLFEAELARRDESPLRGPAAPATAIFGQVEATAEAPSFAVLHGLFWLVLNLADDGPMLLVIDDLHWCDRPSLQFLAYFARRLDGLPVLLVVGLREAEPGADPALLAEITRDPASSALRPRPLSQSGIGALVEQRLGAAPEAEFLAACRNATGGNPLLLTQLVSALAAEGVRPDSAHVGRVAQIGPRAVSRTVLVRLARLPAAARAVAEAVAVLVDGAALPVVAELATVTPADVAEATRALAQAEILRPEPPLSFVHPLVRDAVYHGLTSGERELRHARAATVLHEAGAPAERVAAQLLHTTTLNEPWVVPLLRDAGRVAMQAGAGDSAAAYLRRAVEGAVGARGTLLLELGAAEALTNGPAAAAHLARAYDELSDPEIRADAALILGRTLLFTGFPREAAAVARRTAAELPDELHDQRLGLLAFECMAVSFGTGDVERYSVLRDHRTLPTGGPGSRMQTSRPAGCGSAAASNGRRLRSACPR